ncbi:hypothetical protein RHSIM_RhsimUnG0204700 [Rhododendron simsii]|uniref:Phorbol-ester/DAG-type domain-containing protein n=1 Tax=Rhododendron simsii TaxID=118357 RepID=A0A834L426_RHOSS|nr:hypothetical protein RHSIM_RhsimUnG0204700 [Rhododendron simsii]
MLIEMAPVGSNSNFPRSIPWRNLVGIEIFLVILVGTGAAQEARVPIRLQLLGVVALTNIIMILRARPHAIRASIPNRVLLGRRWFGGSRQLDGAWQWVDGVGWGGLFILNVVNVTLVFSPPLLLLLNSGFLVEGGNVDSVRVVAMVDVRWAAVATQCSELPSEIQHPFHTRHPLFLRQTPFVRCGACGRAFLYRLFSYGCRRCNFDLDIKCASLPTTIRHEAHEYPLNLVDEGCDERCSSCHELCRNYKFRCSDCKFSLHIQCASLPQTHDGHGYDDHAQILKYSPVGIKREEYYCEICEEEMDTKLWFYYCADCNQAFHGKCLYTAADDFANIKLRAIINVKNHPHHLTIQRAKLNGLNCDACHLPCKNLLCECKECGFNLHFHCALDCQTPNERWNTLVVKAAWNMMARASVVVCFSTATKNEEVE